MAPTVFKLSYFVDGVFTNLRLANCIQQDRSGINVSAADDIR